MEGEVADGCGDVVPISCGGLWARDHDGASVMTMALLVRQRAERKLGQLLEEQPKAPAGRKSQEIGSGKEPIATLAQMGISKKLSARVQCTLSSGARPITGGLFSASA